MIKHIALSSVVVGLMTAQVCVGQIAPTKDHDIKIVKEGTDYRLKLEIKHDTQDKGQVVLNAIINLAKEIDGVCAANLYIKFLQALGKQLNERLPVFVQEFTKIEDEKNNEEIANALNKLMRAALSVGGSQENSLAAVVVFAGLSSEASIAAKQAIAASFQQGQMNMLNAVGAADTSKGKIDALVQWLSILYQDMARDAAVALDPFYPIDWVKLGIQRPLIIEKEAVKTIAPEKK